ncbi:TPA: hypothetical protein P0E27_002085 [Vibrio harveyi]|nr:hypothetical protein [Vibrio harveyi]
MYKELKELFHGRAVEICSLFVAVCALFLTIYQARTTSYHNKLALVPMLQFSIEHKKDEYVEISLENVGNGPALVDTYELAAKKITTLSYTLNEFADLNELDISDIIVLTTKIENQNFINSGQSISLLKILAPQEITKEYKALVGYTMTLPLTVCYRSLYQDEFHVLTDSKYLVKESCATDGSFKFGDRWVKYDIPFGNQIIQSEVFGK